MANTIRWYDTSWTLRKSQAIGSASLAGGIYFDGLYYWLTDQTGGTGSLRLYQLEGGSFTILNTIALPAGYSAPTGVTGDGHNIYVACTLTDAGPPVSVTREVLMYDKRGTVLKQLAGFGYPTSVTINDLDFDGHCLIALLTGTATPNGQIFLYEHSTGKILYQSAGFVRQPDMLTFNGGNFPCSALVAGTYYGVHVDRAPIILTPAVALAGQPYGCTFLREFESDQGTPDFYSGEAIAVAYRA